MKCRQARRDLPPGNSSTERQHGNTGGKQEIAASRQTKATVCGSSVLWMKNTRMRLVLLPLCRQRMQIMRQAIPEPVLALVALAWRSPPWRASPRPPDYSWDAWCVVGARTVAMLTWG